MSNFPHCNLSLTPSEFCHHKRNWETTHPRTLWVLFLMGLSAKGSDLPCPYSPFLSVHVWYTELYKPLDSGWLIVRDTLAVSSTDCHMQKTAEDYRKPENVWSSRRTSQHIPTIHIGWPICVWPLLSLSLPYLGMTHPEQMLGCALYLYEHPSSAYRNYWINGHIKLYKYPAKVFCCS